MRASLALLALVTFAALAGCTKDDGAEPPPTPTRSPTVSVSASVSAGPSPTPTPSASPSPTAGPRRDPVTWEVTIRGNDFVNGSLAIQRGDSVRWVHRDGTTSHTVTADDGSFDSSEPPGAPLTQVPGLDTFTFTFTENGEFPYHCEVHPSMRDAVTVRERHDPVPPA